MLSTVFFSALWISVSDCHPSKSVLGTFMNQTGASECDVCLPRYYCVNQDRLDECPTGHYCPGANGYNYSACPIGTFNNVTMLESESECTDCIGGSYCATPGLSMPTGLCAAGYYCEIGVDTPAPENNNTGTGGEVMKKRSCFKFSVGPNMGGMFLSSTNLWLS